MNSADPHGVTETSASTGNLTSRLSTTSGGEHAIDADSATIYCRISLGSDRAALYHHVNVAAHDRGGHFINPWEIPGEWVEDLRRTFRGRC
jgi:microsomal epoxide hydrolase